MSVTVKPYRRRGKTVPATWEVNIRVMRPDGERVRERRKAPASSRSAALRWGQTRERELLVAKPPDERKEVPTLAGAEGARQNQGRRSSTLCTRFS